MDLRSTSQRVLKAHSSDQIAHLFTDPRSAPERTGLSEATANEGHQPIGEKSSIARAIFSKPDAGIASCEMHTDQRPLLVLGSRLGCERWASAIGRSRSARPGRMGIWNA